MQIDRTDIKWNTVLDEDTLIFLTEIILLARLGFHFETNNLLSNFLIESNMEYQYEKLIRSTLLGPLTNQSFRHHFACHFSQHPIDIIREEGDRWLTEMLAVEVD